MVAPIIGLTGGIGAGKSTVAGILTQLGARVIDADRIGHEAYRPGSEGFARVVEAAVLLEAGWRPLVDRVWAVSTRREHAVARILAARDLTREEVERRLDAQMSDAERRRHADLVIENDGSPAALRAAVEAAWRTLVS